jgi:N-acyl homoserine lactone hydrolase
MRSMRMVSCPVLHLIAALVSMLLVRATHAQAGADELRVYALDCGHADFDDAAVAADTGELAGKKLQIANPCFVIRHAHGILLWDAGFPPDVQSPPGTHVSAGPALAGQLAQLGLKPEDITHIAFSHLHFDHVGNANLFGHATWILDRRELAWAEAEPGHVSMKPALFAAYHTAHTIMIEGDYDVFGDGRVRILQTPGHTPGSAVLWLGLRDGGPVLLSGDLYLLRESRQFGYIPTVNADRAATLASSARVERIAKRTGARVIVQHDPRDFAALPKPPNSLH